MCIGVYAFLHPREREYLRENVVNNDYVTLQKKKRRGKKEGKSNSDGAKKK